MVAEAPVIEDFVTTEGTLWEKAREDGEFRYFSNGVPRSAEQYDAARASALPGSEFGDPYDVVDFSADEIDAFAERPDDLEDEEREALKDVRATYTVRYAYENVDFYRGWLDSHGIDPYTVEGTDDLSRIPTFGGDTILRNQPPETRGWPFRNDSGNIRRPFHTSGSTDNPKTLFFSYDEVERMYDDVRRGLTHLGVEEGDKAVNFYPFVGLNVSLFGNEGGMELLDMETVPISNTPYPPDVEANIVRGHAPRDPDTQYIMLGLPSHIDAKGQQYRREGVDPREFGVDEIVLAGEPVSPSRKESIANAFGAEVHEFLGSTEGGAFAYECLEDDERLHLMEDSVHIDVTDPETGGPVGPGEQGQLVVTRLLHPGESSGMPVVRYRLGDLVTYYEDDGFCDCRLEGGRSIRPPTRDSWDFVLGAVNLDPVFFEDAIYDHPELGDSVVDYRLNVTYDEDAGRDRAELEMAAVDPDHVGAAERDVGVTESPENALQDLANELFARNSHLRDTVDTVGAARIDMTVVDEIEREPGKPERLNDTRE